jgi:hypothetical protein
MHRNSTARRLDRRERRTLFAGVVATVARMSPLRVMAHVPTLLVEVVMLVNVMMSVMRVMSMVMMVMLVKNVAVRERLRRNGVWPKHRGGDSKAEMETGTGERFRHRGACRGRRCDERSQGDQRQREQWSVNHRNAPLPEGGWWRVGATRGARCQLRRG